MDIISAHYKDIKKLFVSRISNHGLKFNEDSFNDAFIKCAQHFGNDIIAYDDAIKYFYVAFLCRVCYYNLNKSVPFGTVLGGCM